MWFHNGFYNGFYMGSYSSCTVSTPALSKEAHVGAPRLTHRSGGPPFRPAGVAPARPARWLPHAPLGRAAAAGTEARALLGWCWLALWGMVLDPAQEP